MKLIGLDAILSCAEDNNEIFSDISATYDMHNHRSIQTMNVSEWLLATTKVDSSKFASVAHIYKIGFDKIQVQSEREENQRSN